MFILPGRAREPGAVNFGDWVPYPFPVQYGTESI